MSSTDTSMKESTTEGQDNSLLCACEFAFCSATAHPKTRFLFLKPLPLLLMLVCAYGVAWVRAALVRDLVCPTCSSFSCWVALPCSACASVSPLHPGLPSQFILTLAFLLNSVSPCVPPQFSFTLAFLLNSVSPWPSSNSSSPWPSSSIHLHPLPSQLSSTLAFLQFIFTLAFLLNSVSPWPSSSIHLYPGLPPIHLHPGLSPQFRYTLAFLLNSVSPWPSSSIHLYPGLPPIQFHPGLHPQLSFTLAFLLNSVSPWPSSNSSLPCHAAEPLLCPHNQIVSPFCVHATKS